ncbi:hypothetical protein C0992_011342, partial [Termitomyces sp. T32_za158]
MPNETSKHGKGKQGIKGLGNKDGHVLLTSLQSGELKIIKADPEKIKKEVIAVIATADPTSDNAPEVRSRALYASGKMLSGQFAPKSNAATRVRRRKAPKPVIEINSDSSEELTNNGPPPVSRMQQPPLRSVVSVSSDADNESTKGDPEPSLSK